MGPKDSKPVDSTTEFINHKRFQDVLIITENG